MLKKQNTNNIWQFICSKWIIYVTVFLTPLYISSNHWYLFTTPKALLIMAGTLLSASFFVWGLIKNREEGIKITVLHYFLAIFLLVMSLSGYFGINPGTSFFGTFFSSVSIVLLIILGLLACLISEFVRRDDTFTRYLITSAFASGVVVALVSYIPLFGVKWQFLALSDIGGSTIGNSSFCGAFLLFAIGFGCYLVLTAKGWKVRSSLLLGVLMIMACPTFFNGGIWQGRVSLSAVIDSPLLLIGNAQGALLGVVIMVLASLLLWFAISKKKVISLIGISLFVLSIIGLAFGYVQLLSPQSVVQKKFVESKTATRFVFWSIAEKAFSERPLLGWGFENYQTVYQQHFDPIILQDEYKDEQGVTNPHNIVYDIAVSSGIIGLLSYFLLLAVTCFVFIKSAIKGESGDKWLVIFSGIIMGYFIQNLFIFDTPVSFLVYFLCIGLAMGYLAKEASKKELTIGTDDLFKRQVICWGIISVFAVCFIVFVILPTKESWKWQDLRRSSFTDRVKLIKHLPDISVMGGINDDTRYANQVLNAADELRKVSKDEEQSKIILSVISSTVLLLDKDINNNPGHFYANYEAGMLLHLAFIVDPAHDPVLLDQARKYFDEAHQISPFNPRVYFNLAQNEIFRNNKKSAVEFIKAGMANGAKDEGEAFLVRLNK